MLKQNDLLNQAQMHNFLPTQKEKGTFLIIFLSMVAVFYLNNIQAIKYIAMMIYAAMAFTSKKSLIWLSLYFIIIDMVGGFFTESTLSQATVGVPLLTLTSGISISFKDLLLLALLLNVNNKFSFRGITADHLLIICLLGLAIFIGSTLFGLNYKVFVTVVFRGYFILLLFYLVKREFELETLFKFLHLISYLTIFILIDQIFTASTGNRLLERLLHLNLGVEINSITFETRVAPYGFNTVFFSFIYGLLILSIPKKSNIRIAQYGYGAMLIALASTSILISATRGAIGVFAIILLFVSPYLIIRFRNIAITIGIFFLMLNILGAFGLNWNYFYRNTIARVMSTVTPALAGKEMSEVDTGGRNIELPIIVENIRKSPIVGYGISNELGFVYNNNFGGINTIIQFGILGSIIVFFLLIRWLVLLRRKVRQIPKSSVYNNFGQGVFASLMGMSVGYLTTFNFFTSYYSGDVIRLMLIMSMSAFVFSYSTNTDI